ncbi:MAG: oligosaccharide flippase family protein [Ignavibacteriales bacterium]|nr:oligosaccharide flippase family protein [Ignavibacteriales bacterium]
MSSKLKRLAKDTVLYGISTIVGRFINFILVPVYTNVFAPAEYGIVANVYAIIALFNIVFLFGMDTAYLKYAGMSSEEERPKLFVQAFYTILFTDLLAACIIIVFFDKVTLLMGVPASRGIIVYYTVAILIIDAVTSLPFIALRLQKKALRFSMIKLANIGITIVLNIVLIVVLHQGIESVFLSNLIASAITLVVLIPTISENVKEKFNKELFIRLFKFGIPYLPAGIASMFMQVIDRPIVEKLAGMKMLGIYQANYRLGIFMMLFVSMFQYAWQPFFLENAKDEKAKPLFASVFTYFTATGSFQGISLIGKEYWSGLPIVPVVLLAYLFNGFYANFAAGLFIKEKSVAFPVILGIGAISNVAVNLILIPVMGIMGAALATLFSYALMALLFYIISNRHYPIRYEYMKLGIIVILTAGAELLYYIFIPGLQQKILYKTLLLVVYIAALFVSGVFSKQSVHLLKRKPVQR